MPKVREPKPVDPDIVAMIALIESRLGGTKLLDGGSSLSDCGTRWAGKFGGTSCAPRFVVHCHRDASSPFTGHPWRVVEALEVGFPVPMLMHDELFSDMLVVATSK